MDAQGALDNACHLIVRPCITARYVLGLAARASAAASLREARLVANLGNGIIQHTPGTSSTALWTNGGAFGARVTELLDQDDIDHVSIEIEDRTKQSFAVTDESTGDHYRFTEPGPALAGSEHQPLFDEVSRHRPD